MSDLTDPIFLGIEHDPLLARERDETLARDATAVGELIRSPSDVNARLLPRPSVDSLSR
jgi:hypothetical protein